MRSQGPGILGPLEKNYIKTIQQLKKTVQEVQEVDLARAPGLESWLFDETVSKKLGSRTRILAFCSDCQQKVMFQSKNHGVLLRLSAKSCI